MIVLKLYPNDSLNPVENIMLMVLWIFKFVINFVDNFDACSEHDPV